MKSRTQRVGFAAASTLIAAAMSLALESGTVSAHKTCANKYHTHPGVVWSATKSGSGYQTFYLWYAGANPGESVYQGSIQCPYA
jgi:hypothetical protein